MVFRSVWTGLALIAGGGQAMALGGNWVVLDMGPTRAESVCVAAATQAFQDFGNVYGIDDMTRGNWTVYGYGLDNEDTDAVVTCTFSTANSTRATLIIYSDNQIGAGIIASRFESYFADHNQRLGAEWLQRAFDRVDM